MIRKGIIAPLLIGTLFFGFSHTTHATTLTDLQAILVQLQAQLQILQDTETMPKETCVELSQTLGLGATDASANGQVGKLQQFLKVEGYYTYPTLTGYYGPITASAVSAWQMQNKVAFGGVSEYGTVDPYTLKAFAKGCEPLGSPSITVTSPNAGAYWYPNTTAYVNWSTSNIPLTDSQSILVRLRSVSTGQEFNLGSVNNNKVQSSPWAVTVPSTIPVGAYYIEVKTAIGDKSFVDASDEYIKIVYKDDAQLKSADAAIKTNVSSARAQAEIYWNAIEINLTGTMSYLGVCKVSRQQSGLRDIRNAINLISSNSTCNDSATEWALSASLKTNTSQNFCVDSTGIAIVTTSRLGLSTSCSM